MKKLVLDWGTLRAFEGGGCWHRASKSGAASVSFPIQLLMGGAAALAGWGWRMLSALAAFSPGIIGRRGY